MKAEGASGAGPLEPLPGEGAAGLVEPGIASELQELSIADPSDAAREADVEEEEQYVQVRAWLWCGVVWCGVMWEKGGEGGCVVLLGRSIDRSIDALGPFLVCVCVCWGGGLLLRQLRRCGALR
jgi:hypothetical protein